MSLEEKINNDIKTAMLAKAKDKLEALRAVKAAILLLKSEKASTEINPETEIKLLQRLVKQRKESGEIYLSSGRDDLAKVEFSQAAYIENYLPQQLNLEDVEEIVKKIISQTGAVSIKEMGKVMGAASRELAGKADNKTIAEIIRRYLV